MDDGHDDETQNTIRRNRPPLGLDGQCDVHRGTTSASSRRHYWPRCAGRAERMSTRGAETPMPRRGGTRMSCDRHRYFSMKTCRGCATDV